MPTAAFVPRLLVRSSSIHAAGCYTLDPIRKGKRILEFGFEDRTDVIDGFGTAMFINHSCAPNCETESKDGRVFIRALRDIAPNEELLYEYNLYDSDEDDQTCFCGAENCRGTMYSDWELKRQARLRARKAAREKVAKG
jgi:SET domain-containing protein